MTIDIINIIYVNIQNPLCNSVALISFTPSFIKIRLNLTEKKQDDDFILQLLNLRPWWLTLTGASLCK